MVAPPIFEAFRMLAAVDLDDKSRFSTKKIGVVITDHSLSDKFISSQLSIT